MKKNKDRKLKYRNSKSTSMSNLTKKKERRDLGECSLTTGI